MSNGRTGKMKSARAVLSACLLSLTWPAQVSRPADARKIDAGRSKITVRVFKSGLFSAFAHNHEIDAPLESGNLNETGSLSVEIRMDARKLRVADPEATADTRAKIQETMLGPQVLDANQFPEIHFRSTSVEAQGTDRWLVKGDLEMHGQTHPVAVGVALNGGVYRGSAALKQTEFGIKPVSIGGGTVNVKDEVKIEFEIAAQH